MFRYRLCVVLFMLAQLPALFMAGPASPRPGQFDWNAYEWIGFALPGIASLFIVAVAWLFNPSPAGQSRDPTPWLLRGGPPRQDIFPPER
jgi:hypothetical protein